MIRPLTIVTCLLACGSGLYLYQSKHEVQVLDRTIEKAVHDTGALREQSRLLAAEWTMLNDPQRLQQFSNTYLTLKSIVPTQFTSLADLDSRLPEPQPAAPPQGTDEQAPAAVVADAAPADAPDPTSDAAVVADDDLPVPPIPVMPSAPAVASVAHSDARTADRIPVSHMAVADNPARSVAVADVRPSDQRSYDQRSYDQRSYDQRSYDQRSYDQRPSDQRPSDQRSSERRPYDQRPYDQRPYDQHQAEQRVAPRVVEARTDVRTPIAPSYRPIVLAAPRPMSTYAPINTPPRQYRQPMVAEAAPYSGSLLGMARGTMPPAPRPTPVNASYNAN
jgi:hypothetical protein